MARRSARSDASAPKTARGRARREQLLTVALAAFAAQGFRGASLADIADEVGLSDAGLLHHFPSKEHLLLEVLQAHENHQVEHADEIARRGGGLRDVLLDIARIHERDPAYIRLFTVVAAEAVDAEHPAHEWFVERYDRTRDNFRDRVTQAQQDGAIRADLDPDQIARLLIAVLDGLELQYLLTPTNAAISSPLATLLDMLAP